MAEAALKKKKAMASSFDDDLGEGFLTSWKPGKLNCNAALDLDDSPPPKAVKKFNFANFDMDLDLDGGLNKLANFNLDLSELDLAQKADPCSKDAGYNKVKDAQVILGTDTAKRPNRNYGNQYCAPEKAEDEDFFENEKNTQVMVGTDAPKNSNSGLHFVSKKAEDLSELALSQKADPCSKDDGYNKVKDAQVIVGTDTAKSPNSDYGNQYCAPEKAEDEDFFENEKDTQVMVGMDAPKNSNSNSGLHFVSKKAESCFTDKHKEASDVVMADADTNINSGLRCGSETADADNAADKNPNSEPHSVSESCSRNKHKDVSDIVVMTDADNGTDSLPPLDHAVIDKAEAYSEVLENMCKMLKQKNEEAKDLMVRALVTNNSLLMLNSPLHEEKMLLLESSTSKLLVEEEH